MVPLSTPVCPDQNKEGPANGERERHRVGEGRGGKEEVRARNNLGNHGVREGPGVVHGNGERSGGGLALSLQGGWRMGLGVAREARCRA